jgi:CO/xanthine dehydrogenase Mo-binding subunit
MAMGLGLATREEFKYSEGRVEDTSLRTYKVLHFGEEPQYIVDLLETPNLESPYGNRGFSEHGVIAISAAVANALSAATGISLDSLPIYPEKIWKQAGEKI